MKELVELLRPDWPSVNQRTIHFYASKGIIGPRRRGRGAKYYQLDRLRLLVAVRMRWAGKKLTEIAARIKSMNQETLEKYVSESLLPLSDNLHMYRADRDDSLFTVRDEHVASRDQRSETWSRIALGEGVELAIRTDVVLRERLPAIIAALKDLANEP